MSPLPALAARLALLTVLAGLGLGGAALGLGVAAGAICLWGFGAACLLQVPPALSLRSRIREGLGNSGLERERLTLRTVGYLLRLLALGLCLASVLALVGGGSPQTQPSSLTLAVLAVGVLALLWQWKRGLKGVHPALDLDADRTRGLLELAALLLLGSLLGHWYPWADGAAGLAQALHLFFAGRTLAKATTLQAVCGGCGGGCGCG